MHWLVSLCMAMLLSGCTAASSDKMAHQALREHEKLMAAAYQQHPLAYATALNRVRPLVTRLLRELDRTDPDLAASVRNPFLRLEVVSLGNPPDWASVLREAVLLQTALSNVAGQEHSALPGQDAEEAGNSEALALGDDNSGGYCHRSVGCDRILPVDRRKGGS